MNLTQMKSNYHPAASKFRVSQRKHVRRYPIYNKQIASVVNRLNSPKVEYIPNDPFLYSDFRGLLNADFKEALTNCFSQDDLNRINTEQAFGEMVSSSKLATSMNQSNDIASKTG